jgi:hypothetical protein
MDGTHIRWLEESLERNTVQKILKAENGRIGKDKESMTEKRNQRELLCFQTGGALNFITAAPHCGNSTDKDEDFLLIGSRKHVRSLLDHCKTMGLMAPGIAMVIRPVLMD